MQKQGTLSFVLKIDRLLRNGTDAKHQELNVLTLDGLARFYIDVDRPAVSLTMKWDAAPGYLNAYTRVAELPAGEYFVQMAWDADRGLFDSYFNGFSPREPASAFEPWAFKGEPAHGITVAAENNGVSVRDVASSAAYIEPGKLGAAVPEAFLHQHPEVFLPQHNAMAAPLQVQAGKTLLSAPLAAAEDVKSWVMEGAGDVQFKDGWMTLSSQRPGGVGKAHGHFVFWCPQTFPDRFVADWDVQILSPQGLNIVFFAAHATQSGGSIFEPSLKPRDGTFDNYLVGDISSYHISYYSDLAYEPARLQTNLRKNPPSYLAAIGPIGIKAGSKDVHHMRLIKLGDHIQMQRDGEVILDATDNHPERFGPAYGAGEIGFRQMQWTVARYRNFVVSEVR